MKYAIRIVDNQSRMVAHMVHKDRKEWTKRTAERYCDEYNTTHGMTSNCVAEIDIPLFEIREGDGNEGCFRRGTISAVDAFEALRLASRRGMIYKPRDTKVSDIDGDNEHASWCSYVAPIFGDACRWIAEANIVKGGE